METSLIENNFQIEVNRKNEQWFLTQGARPAYNPTEHLFFLLGGSGIQCRNSLEVLKLQNNFRWLQVATEVEFLEIQKAYDIKVSNFEESG